MKAALENILGADCRPVWWEGTNLCRLPCLSCSAGWSLWGLNSTLYSASLHAHQVRGLCEAILVCDQFFQEPYLASLIRGS